MKLFDSLVNLVSGLGTNKDKSIFTQYANVEITRDQLNAAYRGDWIARKVVDLPAYDSTREWRAWQADDAQIEKLEEIERVLDIQRKVRRGMAMARLYGGAALILGIDGAGESQEELDLERVKPGSLKFVHVVAQHEVSADQLETDIMSPWFNEPRSYQRNNIQGVTQLKVHPSRVIRLIGCEILDQVLINPNMWGDSILKIVNDAILSAGTVQAGIATLVHEAKSDVIKIPDLSKNLTTAEYTAKLTARLTYANQVKSMLNTRVMDSQEEWDQMQISFGTLPDILKMYLLIASGAADIPATRMLGQSPAGLSSTGESDIRNYYDRLASEQVTTLQPALSRLDEVLIRAALGERDPDIYYEWNSLWQMSDQEKADIAVKKAQVFTSDVNAGLISSEALRKVRENQLVEDGWYPGLEAALDEFPDEPLPTQEELLNAALAANEASANEGEATTGEKVVGSKKATVKDASPRTLYVRRDVLNAEEIKAWAKGQGFETTVPAEEMHVTIMYSKKPVDWIKMGETYGYGDNKEDRAKGEILITAGGPRVVEPLGNKGAVVLMFSSSELCWRHESMKMNGCSYDFAQYQPHVTITYSGKMPEGSIEPFRGALHLGPEIFEEIKPFSVVEDENPNHYPAGAEGGKGGEFAPKEGGSVTPEPGTEHLKFEAPKPVHSQQYLKTVSQPAGISNKYRQSVREMIKEAQGKGDHAAITELNKKLAESYNAKAQQLKNKGMHSEAASHEKKAQKLGFKPLMEQKEAPFSGSVKVTSHPLNSPPPPPPIPLKNPNDQFEASIKKLAGSHGGMLIAKAEHKGPSDVPSSAKAHIMYYTGSGYADINKALRVGAATEEQWGYAKKLNDALSMLPAHEGLVTRKATSNPYLIKQLDMMKPGVVIEERGFLSTSVKPEVWSGDVFYEIMSKTGRKLGNISQHPGEGEVLFRSGTRFKVESNEYKVVQGTKRRVIRMREIEL